MPLIVWVFYCVSSVYCYRREKQQLSDVYLSSRHHRGKIKDPLNNLDHHSTMELSGLRGTLNWSPIIPRDASLSDSWCNFTFPHFVHWMMHSLCGCGSVDNTLLQLTTIAGNVLIRNLFTHSWWHFYTPMNNLSYSRYSRPVDFAGTRNWFFFCWILFMNNFNLNPNFDCHWNTYEWLDNQTEIRLVSNQSETCKYNPCLV